MGTDELTDFMMATSVLPKSFSREEISALAGLLQIEEYPAGEILIQEGTPACSLMLLISGEVRRMLGDVELNLLHAGEFLGKSMFTDEGSHYANVVATEPVVAGRLSIEQYGLLVEAAPVASRKFKQYFSDIYMQEVHEKQGLSFVDHRSYLGLVAHNEMKESLMEFAKTHAEKLKRFHLVATGTTGIKLYKEVGLMISKNLASGPLGGDQAIGKMISENNIKGLIFFRDPLSAHPHHADIEALGRLCEYTGTDGNCGAAAMLNYLLVDHPEEPAFNRVPEKYKSAQEEGGGAAGA